MEVEDLEEYIKQFSEHICDIDENKDSTFGENKENDYNLNIPRYVDTFEEEVVPLKLIAKELQEIEADIELKKFINTFCENK